MPETYTPLAERPTSAKVAVGLAIGVVSASIAVVIFSLVTMDV